jgi:hypothetical protein
MLESTFVTPTRLSENYDIYLILIYEIGSRHEFLKTTISFAIERNEIVGVGQQEYYVSMAD